MTTDTGLREATKVPIFRLSRCLLRPWRDGDIFSLAHHADDEAVSRCLRDGFPFPYTLDDARRWIRVGCRAIPGMALAVEADGEAVGGMHLRVAGGDWRRVGELAYWLGRAYWGRGIMTEAVGALCRHAFGVLQLPRVTAEVFVGNLASMRVLEKNRFVREGVLLRSAVKAGRLIDQALYARTAPTASSRFGR